LAAWPVSVTSSVVPREAPVPVAAKLIVPPLERPASEVKLRPMFWATARLRVMVASPAVTARAPRAWDWADEAPVLSRTKLEVPPKVRAWEASVPPKARDWVSVPWLIVKPPEKVLALPKE